jgi:hypothetical protein
MEDTIDTADGAIVAPDYLHIVCSHTRTQKVEQDADSTKV